ncbi:hypothetical protein DYB28_001731 [Aphanomyces astaci]|uniref:Uncharacterized protein n=1 Tax=Aphanomyces astaci TaxID=112090 RepID=A0A9X8E5I5_APHAT|nr:hypothetical protein DYB28_001731 [Aphanomyces astaci]
MDADSRIGKMLENLMRGLERDNQAWVLDQGGKTVVDIMVKAIKPLGLQKSVQRLLALQRNKPLKSNVYRFLDWLGRHITGYHLYTPVEDEKTSAPPAAATAAPSRPSKLERSEGSIGSSSGPPRRAPPLSKTARSRELPMCAPGESERLLKKLMDYRCHEVPSVEVKVISPEPSVIQPYGQAPALKVDHQKQFKLVTLDTPCGALALRGLKAWVDSSSNAAELLISRAVVERLGFSDDEFLSHAFAKQEVWDVSDVDKPSAMASVSRLTQVAASSDECGDDGMHCVTPNIQVPSAEDV